MDSAQTHLHRFSNTLGTYVSVEPFHLAKYLDEQVFRFNERKSNDKERFLGVLKAVSGKRLNYDELRGYQTTQ